MKTTYLGLLILGAMTTLSGCAKLDGRVTAGGTLHSQGGDGKAVFTAHAARCDGDIKGRVNYQDKTAIDWQQFGGIAFKANVTGAGLCSEDPVAPDGLEDETRHCKQDICTEGMFQVEFNYDSTNPAAPGEGTGFACMMDIGEGINSGFGANGILNVMLLESGPYQGYHNAGTMSGNVQVHDCPSSDDDA
ncbi:MULTISPECIES: hypothetical protein [unclassified Pseudoalteromonas]|uniref:hypothetical protein n=1 Tax=unclassified Pseudoalteromonas TaxID=194690 RepID=UPI001319C9E7|nr:MULTISPECIES: hypothetical protein [unclassified Pseudoalteromonas]